MPPPAMRIVGAPPLWLFAFGLALRLVFWWAGPDGGGFWHIGFLGDASIWEDLGRRLHGDLVLDDELRLPWRSPGMLWLVAGLWCGGTAWPLRLCAIVAGATTGPLLWWLVRPYTSAHCALVAGGITAAASSLLLASSGVQVEAFYVPLVLLALRLQARLLAPHRAWLPLAFGALHAAICLLRTEHLVFLAAWGVLLLAARVRWSSLLLAAAAFAAVLVPWQLHAAALVAAWNGAPHAVPMRALPWDAAASAAVGSLPPFAQPEVIRVVDDTVRHRGGRRVGVDDLAIVREAYGYWPEAVPVPLIALYGGLSFFVANAPEGAEGGTWAANDRPPPLLGGPERYPPWLRPRPGEHRQYSLAYPPHLEIALHGYRLGVREILADPGGWAVRVLWKFWYALGGAVPGLGGYALPIGLSGERRPVDMVAATGAWAGAYRLAVLVLALAGLARLRRCRGLWPLFAFGLVKLVVIAAFFGQARHGVLLVPLVALGAAEMLALAAARWPRLGARRHAVAAALLLVLLEGVRAATAGASVDGRPVVGGEPFGPRDFVTRTVEFR